jgi:hypothetical protein
MKKIFADNLALIEDNKFTYLSAAVAAGVATLTTQSIIGFGIDQILLIGEFGNEYSEIILTHAATAPTGTTITLASNLVFAHPVDTKVTIINYNQADYAHSVTATGAKTTMDTIAIQADQKATQYTDTTYDSGFYFIRWKETIGNTYSDYSDPIPYGDYDFNTVGSIIRRALESMGEEITTSISHQWLLDRLWEARRLVDGKRKRWSWRQAFNYDAGNASTGMYRLAVPTDLRDPNTAKNILGLRIGKSENLEYITKAEWDEEMESVGHTTLASDYAIVDATITLTDSRDFDESGTINIAGDTIKYSANDEATGVLTIETAGTSAHTAADDVWQNVSFGLPSKFTVWNGYIYFNCPIDDDYVDQNVWLDYYKEMSVYDSDADVLDEPEYDFYTSYLKYAIKKKKDPAAVPDDDYKNFLEGVSDLIGKETSGQLIRLVPDIE